MEFEKETDFVIDVKGVIRFRGKLCVPSNENLKKEILSEAHLTLYSIHPKSTKMYRDLKQCY